MNQISTTQTADSQVAEFDRLPDTAMLQSRAVAKLLGVANGTVWAWAAAGRLRPVKVGPNSTRFRVGDVRALIAPTQAAAKKNSPGK